LQRRRFKVVPVVNVLRKVSVYILENYRTWGTSFDG